MFFFKENKNLKNVFEPKREQHPFHLVKPSPWPFLTAWLLMSNVLNLVSYLHDWNQTNCPTYFCYIFSFIFWIRLVPFILLVITLYYWFGDIIAESMYEGQHTKKVQKGIKIGFFLFLVSEAMFFFGLFWAFFHYSLVPSVHVGGIWPPYGIETPSPYGIALLNTTILISSGVSITWAHRAIVAGIRKDSLHALLVTIIYAFYFLFMQYLEYVYFLNFNINDSVYGSIFYTLTGFHGFHVILGTLSLIIAFVRQYNYHFLVENHLGFEITAWYWHFVDIIWILVYLIVYLWGS